jgi:MFS transporter, DHA2 family, multidrug resistance protein
MLTARVLEGLGASGILGVNTALVGFVYPGRLQGQGFGYNALVVATAFTLGPTIASSILAVGPWSWLLAINIPFGVVAILVGLNTLPRTPRAAHAFDFPGALMTAGCLGLFFLGIGSAAHHEGSGPVSIELAFAALLGWALIRRQTDSPAPVLPIDLFRRPVFALSTATAICSFAVQGLAFVSLPFYFEDILGRSQVETGFFMTPWPLVVAIRRRSPDIDPTAIQQVFSAASVWLCSVWEWSCWRCFQPTHPHVVDIVWRIAICGCGFGFF